MKEIILRTTVIEVTIIVVLFYHMVTFYIATVSYVMSVGFTSITFVPIWIGISLSNCVLCIHALKNPTVKKTHLNLIIGKEKRKLGYWITVTKVYRIFIHLCPSLNVNSVTGDLKGVKLK